ncbi:MAG TPA: septal ring lytic transglycosylase RlpA family protein [Rhodospirillales bacterium]|nr:septal ring lytic transglycosylase RlpA family protein [Rhodospirillales bacterium]
MLLFKISGNFIRVICFLLGALFLLSSCAETQLIVHTAKRLTKSKPSPVKEKGKYKIGNPYQIKGIWYHPKVDYGYNRTGVASWYGPGFHGKKTANGEIYDQNGLTAAHKTLPMPSLVQVTNLQNGRSLRLRINDRGPYAYGRIIDLSRRGAQLLGFHRQGTARVRVQVLESESRLLAHHAKGGQIMASIGSPIPSDIKLPKAGVDKDILLPPKGASTVSAQKIPQNSKNSVIRRSIVSERTSVSSVQPDGQITTVAIKPSDIFIQVGAFTQFQNAHQAAARLSILNNVSVTSAIVNGKEFFRVRAGPIKTLSDADFLLESILHSGFDAARLIVD